MKQMKTDYKLMRRPGRLIDRIISEDWTKKNKNNFVCFGVLIISTDMYSIDKLLTNHNEP